MCGRKLAFGNALLSVNRHFSPQSALVIEFSEQLIMSTSSAIAAALATAPSHKAAPKTEWCREYVYTVPESTFLRDLMAAMTEAGYSNDDILSVRLALEEAVANAYTHGNRRDAKKRIKISFRVTRRKVRAEVEDEGQGFKPRHVPDPTLPQNVDQDRGRGVFLMRTFMTRVRFNRRGNKVTLFKSKSEV